MKKEFDMERFYRRDGTLYPIEKKGLLEWGCDLQSEIFTRESLSNRQLSKKQRELPTEPPVTVEEREALEDYIYCRVFLTIANTIKGEKK